MCPVPDAAAYLAGHWSIDRIVVDERTGDRGSFTGTAEFRRVDDELLELESGEFVWGGVANPASRTHRLVPRADGTADVLFGDGKPFHDLDLRTGRWSTRHPCAADLYDGEFTVVSHDEWHLRWRVAGPAKTQLLTSVYRRIRPAG
ncbi:DUF6314 family protein [Streptomyces sp. SID3343]|uniref:DUF6314 family protein n=1 Tax=Streptomyces sp. SID3343 TaxID=2690260 RepID=UPI001371A813|nr:DUF6314 family protein [Streptomyces sp. SID3343]MYW01750.1 hypothetical protein [Streptomyces sp. SID3343]